MSNLSVFEFNSNQVRIIDIDGEPWFVAKDLCQILGVNNNRQALTRLEDCEKCTIILNDGTEGNPKVSIVSESGMYALVLSSRKPQARNFRLWVTSEVLPSIRKAGIYNAIPFRLTEDSSLVSFEADDYWVASTSVAEVFGKEHETVLCDFDRALEDALKFEPITNTSGLLKKINTTYIDARNRVQQAYKVNRALFNYVVLGYQGDAAKAYRIKFIAAFEELERKIKIYMAQQMIYQNPKRQQVYVLRNTVSGMIKVGITNNIERRVSELQNASGCEIAVEYLAPKSDNARDVEQVMHLLLSEYRGMGEWFDVDPKEVIALLQDQGLIIQPYSILPSQLPSQ